MKLLCSLVLAFSSAGLAETPQPQLRADLQQALSTAACQTKAVLRPLELWQWGVYDAQMQATWIESPAPISQDQLAEQAVMQAVETAHRGYAFGLCSPQSAWIITTPAPVAILEKRGSVVALNAAGLLGSCPEFDLDSALSQGGEPRSLLKKSHSEPNTLQINQAFLGQGTLAVTCHPAAKAKRGPELWALMPIGDWDFSFVPAYEEQGEPQESHLLAWIKAVRAQHQLKDLKTGEALLARFARQLLQHSSIRHPRPLLWAQAQKLERSHGKLLGENRVKAMSSREMAWLLWNSPQHRRLLLHKKANAIDLKLSTSSPEKLLVMVVARI